MSISTKNYLSLALSVIISYSVIGQAFGARGLPLDVAIQTTPITLAHPNVRPHIAKTLITEAQFSEKVHTLAKRYFENTKTFNIAEPANSFILAELKYGILIAPHLNEKIICVTLKYEFDNQGINGCGDKVDKALKDAFKALMKKRKVLYRDIAKSKREFHWLDFLEKTSIYAPDGSSYAYNLSEDRFSANTAKQNIRWLISNSLRLSESDDAISFFETGDILGSILSDPERLIKHRPLLEELIQRTPKRYRLWSFVMHQAVRVGAPVEVIELIKDKRGTYDDFLDQTGNTPLVQAVLQSNLAQVEFLIEEGSDPHHINKNQFQAIHLAAAAAALTADFSVMDALLEHGVDINTSNENGTSPLAMAIAFDGFKNGDLDGDKLVQAFNRRGSFASNPLGADKRSASPLYLAIRYGDRKAVEALIKLGAYIDVGPADTHNILQYALSLKDDDISRLLVEAGANLNLVDPLDKTPLEVSVASGSDEIAALLVRKGAAPREINGASYPKIHDSLALGMRALSSALLASGADVNELDQSGRSPMSIAFEKQDLSAVILLLRNGANPNYVGRNGKTLVHLAASRSHTRLIRLLGDLKADFKATDAQGRNALHYAYPDGSRELDSLTADLIDILVTLGVDHDQRNKAGKTARQEYITSRDAFLAQELRKRLADLEEQRMREERRIEQEQRLARQREEQERNRVASYRKPYKQPDVMGTFMKSLGRELIKGAHEIRQAKEQINRENRAFFEQQQRYREARESKNRQLERDRQLRNKNARTEAARRKANLQEKYERQRQAEYARGKARQGAIKRSVTEMENRNRTIARSESQYTSTIVGKSSSSGSDSNNKVLSSSRSWDENAYGACVDAAKSVMTDSSDDNQSEAAEAFGIACRVLWSGVHSVDFNQSPALKCNTKSIFDSTINNKLREAQISAYMSYANKAWNMWKSNLGCR